MNAVLYIANFHLQAALRLEPELRGKPAALMEGEPKPVIFELTEAARKFGIGPGQTSTQALARCREMIFRTRSRAQEQAAAETLLQCAYCFSPRIEATADGVCTMDLTGLPVEAVLKEQRREEVEAWAEAICSALEGVALAAQIGIAETPHLAWQAAKMARPLWVVHHAEEFRWGENEDGSAGASPYRASRNLQFQSPEEFISELPLENLMMPKELLEILKKWGVHTAGAYIALGKEKIAERLGAEAVEIFELATEKQSRPLKLIAPPETFEESMEFEPPVEMLEPLLFGLRRFVESLTRRLNLMYLVAGELRLQLGLSSGDTYERVFVVPAPTSDDAVLFRMMHTHLENLRTESPIHSLTLGAKPARALRYQFGLFEAALRDPNQFQETLARLTALLGPNQVGTPRVEETHRPDSFQLDTESIAQGVFGGGGKDEGLGTALPNYSGGLALRRFRPPIPATVQLRGMKPAILHSAAARGAIVEAQGPWRISGDWWADRGWARDEWDVQTNDGGLYRLVFQNEQWFVEGALD